MYKLYWFNWKYNCNTIQSQIEALIKCFNVIYWEKKMQKLSDSNVLKVIIVLTENLILNVKGTVHLFG